MMRRFILGIFLSFMAISCYINPKDKVDRNKIREEMKDREIKKVSEVSILEEAYRQGAIIADSCQKTLMAAQNAISKDEKGEATIIDHSIVDSVINSLEKHYKSSIKRINLKGNSYNEPDSIEVQLLEAYKYNFENGLALDNNVQKIGDDFFIYTRPVFFESTFPAGSGEEVKSKLDSAENNSTGNFEGMWSIRLYRRELVKAL